MKIAIYLDEVNQAIDNSMQWNVMHQLGGELSSMHEVLFMDAKKIGQAAVHMQLLKQDYDSLLMYNKTGTNLVDPVSGSNLLSIINRPKISWLVEHPVTFFDNYKKTNSDGRSYIFPNPHHHSFSKKMGIEGKNHSMLFGSSVKDNIIDFKERKFDVCIAAQWRGPAEINEFWKGGTSFEKKFFNTINILQNLDDSGDVFTAFLAAAEYFNVPLENIENFMPALKALYWHARKTERIKLVKDLVLTGLKVLLVGGEDWKKVLPEYSNVTFASPCSHEKLMEYYRNSRAVASTNCSNGANERTFDAMSCGALSISEKSTTLLKYFNEKNILFYDRMRLNENNNDIVDLLRSKNLAESIANEGMNSFKKSHTWMHRAQELNEFIVSCNHVQKKPNQYSSRVAKSDLILTENDCRAIVFAHYDVYGKVHLDTLELIRELVNYSVEIIFVSTNISEASFEALRKYCKIIRRENYGYDFWSYKVGVEAISDKEKLKSILFLNNSFVVTDPVRLCEEYFSVKKDTDCLFGLTISNQISRHIQSYWMEFIGEKLIKSKDFEDWWASMVPISNQKEVILNYEVGLSSSFIKKGYKLGSLFVPDNNEKLIASMRSIVNYHYALDDTVVSGDMTSFDINLAKKLNPTSLLWYELLEKFHFIKFKTMQSNNHDFSNYLLNKYISGLSEISQLKCIDYLSDRNILN